MNDANPISIAVSAAISVAVAFIIIIAYIYNCCRGVVVGAADTADAIADDYPFARKYRTDKEITTAFDAIAANYFEYNRAEFTVPLLEREPGAPPMTFDGAYLQIVQPDSFFEKSTWLSDIFNEQCRAVCKRYTDKSTPASYWAQHRAEFSRDAATAAGQLYKKCVGCTTFRAELLVGFAKMLNARSILDISAGWGDRLLGALALSKQRNDVKYFGVDPNECLHQGYAAMISRFSNDPAAFQLVCDKFQQAKIVGSYDMVFTSPPYFNVEEYSNAASQSVVEFSNVDAWFNGFLAPSLDAAWAALVPGGHMVIHINNSPGEPDYTVRMINYMKKYGGFRGIIGKVNENGVSRSFNAVARHQRRPSATVSARPVFVWWKECDIITLAPLAAEHVDGLFLLASDPRIMDTIAAGRTWTREKIVNMAETAASDLLTPAAEREYWHWAVLCHKTVVGYICFYPLAGEPTSSSEPTDGSATDDGQLQIRLFIGTFWQSRGWSSRMIADAARAYRAAGGTAEYLYKQAVESNIMSVNSGRRLGFEYVGRYKINGIEVIRQRALIDRIIVA